MPPWRRRRIRICGHASMEKKKNQVRIESLQALTFDLLLQSEQIFWHSSPEILLYILCFQTIPLEASLEQPVCAFVMHSSTTATITEQQLNYDDIYVKQKLKIGHGFPPLRASKKWSLAGFLPPNGKFFARGGLYIFIFQVQDKLQHINEYSNRRVYFSTTNPNHNKYFNQTITIEYKYINVMVS